MFLNSLKFYSDFRMLVSYVPMKVQDFFVTIRLLINFLTKLTSELSRNYDVKISCS